MLVANEPGLLINAVYLHPQPQQGRNTNAIRIVNLAEQRYGTGSMLRTAQCIGLHCPTYSRASKTAHSLHRAANTCLPADPDPHVKSTNLLPVWLTGPLGVDCLLHARGLVSERSASTGRGGNGGNGFAIGDGNTVAIGGFVDAQMTEWNRPGSCLLPGVAA